MSMRTALITGVNGQDGSFLSEHLLGRGYRVVGIVRTPEQASAPRVAGVEPVSIDLCDGYAVRKLLDRCAPDEIYHLAAHHHSSQEKRLDTLVSAKQGMVATNFDATQTLAFAVLQSGARPSFVFAASSQMYTATASVERIGTDSPRRPATFYGHVKSWSCDLLAQLRAELDLRAGSAILFNHESTRRGEQFVSRKITRAAASIRLGAAGKLEIHNSLARVDWSSARDVVRAMHLMATAHDARDYVIASGQLHSVADLLEVAFGHCGLRWQDHTIVRSSRAEPALCGDPGDLEASLGWQRETGFDAMIREMVEHDLALLA